MATEKQIIANRRNALRSTGPKTPEGKAVSSLNGLDHGLRAATVVLPGENHDAFVQLCEALKRQWLPQGPTEEFYVEQMAVSHWKLARAEQRERTVEERIFGIDRKIPLLEKISQSISRLERSYSKAQRELERLQQARRQDPTPAPQPVKVAQPTPEPPPAYTMSSNALHASPFVASHGGESHQPAT